MWFYLRHFTILYFCIYGGQAGSSSSKPSPTSHTYPQPRDLWTEIREVTHDYIDASSRDKTPDSLFHPTSFLKSRIWSSLSAHRTITPECVQTLLSGCFKNTTYSQYAPGTRRMVQRI